MKLRAALLPKQAEYVNTAAPVALYAGGVGAGKTIANVILAIRLAIEFPGIDILVAAPTYAMLRDTVMREFQNRCPRGLLSDFRIGIYPEAVFHPNRGRVSTIRFRSFDDPGKPKGITIGAAIIDEITEMSEDILEEIIKRLRQNGMPCLLRLTTNPDSKTHYVFTRFVEPALNGAPEIKYIQVSSFDNFTLPKSYFAHLARIKELRPGHYRRSVLGEWGDFFEDRIGPFATVPAFVSPYRVAFIDTSFSDRKSSDKTSVAITEMVPVHGKEKEYWPIHFTGKSWQQSITNPDVIRELLFFLDQFHPIETCLESQLADSTQLFIDRFRLAEKEMGLQIKNHWTVFHQTRNKHERIMFDVAGNKDRMFVLDGTDTSFLNGVVNYTKNAQHDDEPDSLAGAVDLWRTSKALAQYIRMAAKL